MTLRRLVLVSWVVIVVGVVMVLAWRTMCEAADAALDAVYPPRPGP